MNYNAAQELRSLVIDYQNNPVGLETLHPFLKRITECIANISSKYDSNNLIKILTWVLNREVDDIVRSDEKYSLDKPEGKDQPITLLAQLVKGDQKIYTMELGNVIRAESKITCIAEMSKILNKYLKSLISKLKYEEENQPWLSDPLYKRSMVLLNKAKRRGNKRTTYSESQQDIDINNLSSQAEITGSEQSIPKRSLLGRPT